MTIVLGILLSKYATKRLTETALDNDRQAVYRSFWLAWDAITRDHRPAGTGDT
jgi:hypothetical protein